MATVTADEAERIRAAAESQGDSSNVIPGQTQIPPADDPEHPAWHGGEFQEQPQETVYVEQIRIDGTHQTALDVGGKRALSAVLTVSGKVTVDGSLRKGDVLTGTFTAVVRGVSSKDKVDKASGVVVEAEEKFTAQLVDLELD